MISRQRRLQSLILNFVIARILLSFNNKVAHSWTPPVNGFEEITRRDFASKGLIGSSVLASLALPADAASPSLAQKLSLRDPSALTNSVFNIPPSTQVYPQFMRGSWNVTLQYSGYIFPSQRIPRSRLTTNPQIPGFQKCSIAALSDVGKEVVHFTLKIDEITGFEDRKTSLTTSINDHLGYPAVEDIIYNPKANPNRLSLVFYGYKTTNAERIELFCNGRESELIKSENGLEGRGDIFVCSEYVRQVTFSGGSQVGIPRQVGTNYAHFWTWKEIPGSGNDMITGNLLTACYLDPQDSMFFEEPSKPVAVFSHVIKAERIQS